MQTLSNKIKGFIYDLIYPKSCVSCGKLDEVFCDDCKSKIIFNKAQNCPFCQKITPKGVVCSTCRGKHHLTGVAVMAHYEEPLVTAIQKYKYEFIKILAEDLAEMAWPTFQDFGEKIILTCVPSHPKRIAWRGFNPALEIAKLLARDSGVVFNEKLLRRLNYEIPQTQLSRKERFENVKNAFEADKNTDIAGKTIVIFDDLVTSGATLDACALALRKRGAKRVWGFTLARHR